MAQLTAFGKEVRKLRIDRNETLRQMADAMNASPAFLSAVETGAKPLPAGFVERVAKHFEADEALKRKLEEAAKMSQTKVQINLVNSSEQDRTLALAFARKLPTLTEAEKNEFMAILLNDKQGSNG